MPASLEAAAIFAVLIVPGFLVIRGFRRTRAHGLPSRDLYALAEAVVISLGWLPIVWLLGGGALLDWIQGDAVDEHEAEILGIVLLNLGVAYLAGLLTGRALDLLGDHPDSRLAEAVAWTGIFDAPNAWDAAWLRVTTADWAVVELELRSGPRLYVGFDENSNVDLSPKLTRYLFFDTEYRLLDDGSLEAEEEQQGIWIDGADVLAIRFLAIRSLSE